MIEINNFVVSSFLHRLETKRLDGEKTLQFPRGDFFESCPFVRRNKCPFLSSFGQDLIEATVGPCVLFLFDTFKHAFFFNQSAVLIFEFTVNLPLLYNQSIVQHLSLLHEIPMAGI